MEPNKDIIERMEDCLVAAEKMIDAKHRTYSGCSRDVLNMALALYKKGYGESIKGQSDWERRHHRRGDENDE